MATRYDDLDQHYDPDLYLPIRSVLYQVPAPEISEVDRIRPYMWGPEAENFTPEMEQAEIEKILGPAYLEMAANHVPAPFVNHAGRTALFHFCSGPQGPELGRQFWAFAHLNERIDSLKLLEFIRAEREKKRNTDAASEAMKANGNADR